jgi:hypothetical protein
MTGYGTNLPISNVRFDGECGGKADNICSMRVLLSLTLSGILRDAPGGVLV